MSRKKSTRTTSYFNGTKRTSELENGEELNKYKYVYWNGVQKKVLNEDLIGRKMKVNLDYQDYIDEEQLDFTRNEGVIEHDIKPRKKLHRENWHEESKYEVDRSRKRNRVGEIYGVNYDEYEEETEYENVEELENDYEEEYFQDDEYGEEYQETCACCASKCEECRKVSKWGKISIVMFLILLAGIAGYVISFFDGITH